MVRLFLLTGVCLTALMPMAWAQDRVSIRTGTHSDYSRVVFDWGTSAPYDLQQTEPGVLDLTFRKNAVPDLTAVEKLPNVASVEKLSADGENLKIRIRIPADSKYRHFLIGDRVVVDVYNSATGTKAVAAPVSAKPTEEEPVQATTAPTPTAKPATTPPVVDAAPVPTPAETTPAPVAAAESAPETVAVVDQGPTVLEQEAARIADPHVITVSSTEEMGLAAFERNGYLWLVIDRPSLSVLPQINGPKKEEFTPFEKVATSEGGVAYRTRMPGTATIEGEGGGLIWRVIVSPKDKAVEPTPPTREFKSGDDIRGGAMVWAMPLVTKNLSIVDPDVGDTILVATVDAADQFAGTERNFVDFEQLNSSIGLAIVPKADDVKFEKRAGGVAVTRPGGLALSRMRDVTQRIIEQKTTGETENPAATDPTKTPRMFDFNRWMMGGLNALHDNQHILLSGMAEKDKSGRVQDLLMMAKMNMANDRGQEAVGLLRFAESEMPDIKESPEFLALRGVALSMASMFEDGFRDLNTAALKDYPELDYWRAYAAAGLEDWQQAKKLLPTDMTIVSEYPRRLQERMLLRLAEIALRSGEVKAAESMLGMLQKEQQHLQPWTVATMDYLRGEAHRQNKEYTKAEEYWKPLLTGKDDLYRAKAGLALTMLQLDQGTIKLEEAVDRLEGLRYMWRGDELEAQINSRLGKLYLDQARYMKGFSILRDAVAMSPGTDISNDIAYMMTDSFKNLFLSDALEKMSPVDAITVYEEFRELTPDGDDGNRLIRRLAERLVDADLLGRAATLLQYQVDYRLQGREAADTSLRLAAIYLLSDNPNPVLRVLDKATTTYAGLPKDDSVNQKLREAAMLRARALSELKRVDEALAILNTYPPSPDINRLRADIAWNSGRWQDAAIALQDLIVDQAIVAERPLTQAQADIILNRAVALNLAGDRVALANMRERFGDQMMKTSRSKLFDVVTRSRTSTLASDRESIAALVSEVDLFKDFLDTYRASDQPSN